MAEVARTQFVTPCPPVGVDFMPGHSTPTLSQFCGLFCVDKELFVRWLPSFDGSRVVAENDDLLVIPRDHSYGDTFIRFVDFDAVQWQLRVNFFPAADTSSATFSVDFTGYEGYGAAPDDRNEPSLTFPSDAHGRIAPQWCTRPRTWTVTGSFSIRGLARPDEPTGDPKFTAQVFPYITPLAPPSCLSPRHALPCAEGRQAYRFAADRTCCLFSPAWRST